MTESADERHARLVVQAHLGVELTFTDTDGRVDYEFDDASSRACSLEVTTLTDQDLHAATAAFRKHSQDYGDRSTLQSCWQVTVREQGTTYAGLADRLESLLVRLEERGCPVGEWMSPAQLWSEDDSGEGRALFRELASEGVEAVLLHPRTDCPRLHSPTERTHRLSISRMGSYVAEGSDASLTAVEEFVSAHQDNLRKLRDSGAEVRHLFVRLDWATDGSISRPFMGSLGNEFDHFGLPSRPPRLPPDVDELWVFASGGQRGWHWSTPAGWEYIDGISEDADG